MTMPGYNNYYNGFYPNQTNMGAVPDNLNQFKNPYQMMNAQQIQFAPQNDILWVLGEVEATSYPVAPNNTVVLWDKNRNTIYIKSVSAQGIPSMRVLDFVERIEKAQGNTETPKDKFVCIEDFRALEAKFEALSSKIEGTTEEVKENTENG